MSYQPTDAEPPAGRSPLAVSYSRLREGGLSLSIMCDPPGLVEVRGLRRTMISIHVGPSVEISCRRGGYRHRGTAVHGDIDIIPSGTPSSWEMKGKDTILALGVSRSPPGRTGV